MEVKYPDWLTNVVVVSKKNEKWRVYVDYSDLNDAYSKDTSPHPQIDKIVDITTGHELLSFLDAYSGYNHISMFPPDSTKYAFITLIEMYYYNVMSFSHNNSRAT